MSLIHKATSVVKSAQIIATEKTRARRFVGISFRGPSNARRAWIPWAGMDVWEIIDGYESIGYEDYVADMDISEAALDLALSYYETHPEEINAHLRNNDRTPEEWEELYPGVISSPS